MRTLPPQRGKLLVWLLTASFCPLPFVSGFAFLSGAQAPGRAGPKPSERTLLGVVELVAVGPGERARNRACAATGFVVNEDGYLVTNAHVVKDLQGCLSKNPGGKILAKFPAPQESFARGLPCEVVAVEEVHDLAVLKLTVPLPAGAPASPSYECLDAREVPEGTAITVAGHPEFAWRPHTQAGQVVWSGTYQLDEKSAATTEVIGINVPLRPGNSGSPVYLESGGVAGVVVSRDETQRGQSVAIAIRYVTDVLDRYSVKWHGCGP